MTTDKQLTEMPLHLETLEETFAALSPSKLATFESVGQVWAWAKGYLPSMNPEGESVVFTRVWGGVIIGRYQKSVRFGQDVVHEARLGKTVPVRAGRVAIDAALARAKAKFAK